MAYIPRVNDFKLSDYNEKEGLYQFVVELQDGIKCRMFYNRYPEWTVKNISRLHTTPCPICRKDYICKCMENVVDQIHAQVQERELISSVLSQA
ncbi:hypothetical protein [Paenibacillus guangzhouensis]|uniref:hypothetical protein n=1 Tax=Paenibacillus guangzhouensis TaxID=1473112 RepID=UPI00126767CD|nr:hypothetical protein [Paenibacillus guangzhouensis]